MKNTFGGRLVLVMAMVLGASLLPFAPADAKVGGGAFANHASVDVYYQWAVGGNRVEQTVELFQYDRTAGWVSVATVDPGVDQPSFGSSVAVGRRGDRNDPLIVIGVPDSAEAYFYGYDGSDFVLIDVVTGPSIASGFGSSVDVSGGRAIVGAPNAAGGQGSAFLYDTAANLLGELTEPAADADAAIGSVVQIEDDTAWVSAPGQESAVGVVFEFDVTSGVLTDTIKPDNPIAGMEFGRFLSADRGRVLIGGWLQNRAWLQQGAVQTEIPTAGFALFDLALEGNVIGLFTIPSALAAAAGDGFEFDQAALAMGYPVELYSDNGNTGTWTALQDLTVSESTTEIVLGGGWLISGDVGAISVFSAQPVPNNVVGKILPDLGWEHTNFGNRVDVDGTTMVAARGDGTVTGQVVVSQFDAAEWVTKQLIDFPSGPVAGGIAVEGDTMVVSLGDRGDASNPHVAVFTRSPGLQFSLAGTFRTDSGVPARSVAIDETGQTLALGMPTIGEVEVHRGGPASWGTSPQLIKPEDVAGNGTQTFGHDVDFGGDNLVIGKPETASLNAPSALAGLAERWIDDGSEFVYDATLVPDNSAAGDAAGWTVEAEGELLTAVGSPGLGTVQVLRNLGLSDQVLVDPSPAPGAYWGYAMDLDAGVIVINDWVADTVAFDLHPTTITEIGTFQPPDLEQSDAAFSTFPLATSNGTVMVGTRLEDYQGRDAGAVYTFSVTPSPAPSPPRNWSPVVDIDDGWAVVGNPDEDVVHVLQYDGAEWVERQQIVGDASTSFGAGVALEGDILIVGAPDANARLGKIARYNRNTSRQFDLAASAIYSGASAEDRFGSVLDIDGDWVLAGAPVASGGIPNSGTAVIFDIDLTQEVAVLATADTADDFGSAVALGRDTANGAGVQVAWVGAPDDLGSAGRVVSWDWNGSIWRPSSSVFGKNAGDRLGATLDGSGDTVLIGAPGAGALGEFTVARWDESGLVSEAEPFDAAAPFNADTAFNGDVIALGSVTDAEITVFSDNGLPEDYQPLGSTAAAGTGRSVAVDGDWLIDASNANGGLDWTALASIQRISDIGADPQRPAGKLTPDFGTDWANYGAVTDATADTYVIVAPTDAAGLAPGEIQVFDRSTGDLIQRIDSRVIGGTGDVIDVSLDGDSLAVARSGNVEVLTRTGPGGAYDVPGFQVPVADVEAIDLSETTLVMGQPTLNTVVVYEFDGAQYVLDSELTSTFGFAGHRLGDSVAVDGNVVVAGATKADAPSEFGYVIPWSRPSIGAAFTERDQLIGIEHSLAEYDGFGTSIDFDGTHLVVGAPLEDNNAVGDAENQGVIYVVDHTGDGEFTNMVLLDPRGLVSGDPADDIQSKWGTSVALEGDVLVAGGPGFSDAHDGQGAIVLYRFDVAGDNWSIESFVEGDGIASDTEPGDSLGTSVSIGDGLVIAGAAGEDSSGFDAGAAYLFNVPDPVAPEPDNKLLSEVGADLSDGEVGDLFGFAIDTDGNRLAIGAPEYASLPAPLNEIGSGQTGGVYVFTRGEAGWAFETFIENPDGAGTESGFAQAVAIDDDFLAVGAPETGAEEGKAWFIHIPSGTAFEIPAVGSGGSSLFGQAIDLDGDIMAIGSPGYDVDEAGNVVANIGKVDVYERLEGTWTHEFTRYGTGADVRYGRQVDLDGTTLAVGTLDNTNVGYVEVLRRAISDQWDVDPVIAGTQAGGQFGIGLDLDGDNLIIGEPNADNAAVYRWDGVTWGSGVTLTVPGAAAGTDYGLAVAIDGTLAVVGEPGAERSHLFANTAFDEWTLVETYEADDGASPDRFGWAVEVAGGDITIGSPFDDNSNGLDAGAAYTYAATPPPPPDPPEDPAFIAEISYELPATVMPGATTVTIEGTTIATTGGSEATTGTIVAASIGGIDLDEPPTGSTASTNPIGDITLGELGIDAGGAGLAALAQVPLSEFPVEGGWYQYLPPLYDGVPLQAITLGEVWALTTVQSIPLKFTEIEASPLKFTDIAVVGFGGLELLDVDLDGDPATSSLTEWCDVLDAQAATCADLGIDAASTITLGSVSAAGVNIEATPLKFTPLKFTYVEASPLKFTPLKFTDIEASPLKFTPLKFTDIEASPLKFTPLKFTPLKFTPLKFTPLKFTPLKFTDVNATPLKFTPLKFTANPENIADCALVDCDSDTLTLGEVADAGALRDGFTLDDIGDADLGDLRFEDILAGLDEPSTDALLAEVDSQGLTLDDVLAQFGIDGLGDIALGDIDPQAFDDVAELLNFTVGEFLESVDEDELENYTLADFLLLFLPRSSYEWDDVDLGTVNLQLAGMQAPLVASVAFTVEDGPALSDVTVQIDLPTGAVVQPGSFATAGLARVGTTTITDTDVTVEVTNVESGVPQTITFGLYQGLGLGTSTSLATATVDASSASSSDSLSVIEAFEPENDDLAGAVAVLADNLYISHLGSGSDRDFFRLTVTEPSTTVSVQLSNLAADYDLVVYGPKLGSIIPADDNTAASAPDADFDAGGSGSTLSPVPLDDLPASLDELQVYGASYFRGTEAEQVDFLAIEAADYFVQVSGYLGASSPEPYSLRAATTPTTELACPARTFPFAGATAGTNTSVGGSVNTLVLMNRSRLEALFGPDPAAEVVAAAEALVSSVNANGADGVEAAILDLDAFGAITNEYAAWDASPCSTFAVNGVVTAISNEILGIRAGQQIDNVLVLGGDDVVPFARVKDATTIANEQAYTNTFTASTDNALRSAFSGSWLLTDDPYVDQAPTPIANTDRVVYIPELALGRLVETPAEIVGSLEHYVTFNGELDPQTGFVAGYDFLDDGAEQTGDNLDQLVSPATVQRLINETWTASELESALATIQPDAALLAAHFDHSNALSAAGNGAGVSNDLFDVTAAAELDFTGSILFSVGCHGGLSVSDLLIAPSGVVATDWAQTFLGGGAAAYVANTGYGYGDDTAVALSEKIMADFAAGLVEYETVGQALLYAKQDYAADLTVYGAFDEKALMEATMYGIPFYRLGNTVVPEPVPSPPTEPAVTGGEAYTDTFDPVLEVTGDGTEDEVWSTSNDDGEDQVQVTNGYPILPRFEWEVTQQDPGDPQALALDARGVVLEALTTRDEIDVDPATARAVYDLAASEPNVDASDVTFILSPAINTYLTPEGIRQDVNMAVGAFQSSEPGGSGTMRLFEEFEATVYYADDPSAEANKPLITNVQANPAGGAFNLAVSVQDQSDIVRVLALVTTTPVPNAPTTWDLVELSEAAAGTWQGELSVVDGDEVQWLVMAVDTHGNVAWSMSKQLAFDGDADGGFAPNLLNPTAPTEPVAVGETADFAADLWDFDGSSDPLSVSWDFGDDTTCTPGAGGTCELDPPTDADPLGATSASHSYSEPGTYTVTVTATDSNGLTDTLEVGEVVVLSPPAEGTLTDPANGNPVTELRRTDTGRFAGTGFEPNSAIAIELRPEGTVLENIVSDASGAFEVDVQVPATTPLGAHEFVAVGSAPGGSPLEVAVSFTVLDMANLPCTIRGTSGPDVIRGTTGDDVICGFAGNDRIFGRGGNDVIYAGRGNDEVYGGDGNDDIVGGGGNDLIAGGNGNDRLRGQRGDDRVWGGAGDDFIRGGFGNDRVGGGPGDDDVRN